MTIQVDCLNKDELIHELNIRDVTLDVSVPRDALRKQLREVLRLQRRGSLKCAPVTVDVEAEIAACSDKIKDLEKQVDDAIPNNPAVVGRLRSRSDYILERISRIQEQNMEVGKLKGRIITLLSSLVDDESSNSEIEEVIEKVNEEIENRVGECSKSARVMPHKPLDDNPTVYVRDKLNHLNSFNLKYDGTTCVRVFLERVEELRTAREVSDLRMLASFSDLLEKSALSWYRCNKNNFTSYTELTKQLIEDFDIPDLDYKLLGEIRQRTQAKHESIVVYLSIMQCMFGRLSRPMSEQEKLEILTHNIRPEYIKELAMQEIDSIDMLTSILKKLELARVKSEQFVEPDFTKCKATLKLRI